MNEKRCGSCRFWKDDEIEYQGRPFPVCDSAAVFDGVHFIAKITPKSIFGCIHWREKEPDLREQLAVYVQRLLAQYVIFNYLSTECQKNKGLHEADKMIAIFEKWQKGNGDDPLDDT